MFIKRQAHTTWELFYFIFLSTRVIEPNMSTVFFHYHYEVNQQNVTHLTLNGNRKRLMMKNI